jgi:hypothetical protein
MKVLLIETIIPKQVEEAPKFIRTINIMVSLINRLYGGLSVERGFFMKSLDITDTKQDTVIFCGDFFVDKIQDTLNYLVSNFDGVSFNIKDITLDVKLGRCQQSTFITLFKSENSDFNDVSNLETYLEDYLTDDDVLIKVFEQGVDSLTDLEKLVLEEASNNL